ncbi:ABC transporter permease [Guptibacillus algicola]|uniref:ABC transporter permease n=1 Tax=Guptibacillus algicola TaxID=225844 RepID=UPI001CD23E19|nr:ABC transporter permease [Alkalihalobacillus algicola]MCA0987017.1 ABC transporter permease [Alkalihalobacillus algicola]
MHKFWVLVGQTYKSKIKSKTFFWSTILTIMALFGGVMLPGLLTEIKEETSLTSLALVNATPEVEQSLKDNLKGISIKDVQSKKEAETLLYEDTVSGYLALDVGGNELVTKEPVNQQDMQSVAKALQLTKLQRTSDALSISDEKLQELVTPVSLKTDTFHGSDKALSEKERKAAENIAIGLLFVLYMFVMLYGTMIASEIAKEKGSRIMEVIISSSSATSHFFGKLVGVLFISITQLSVFGIIGFIIITYFGSDTVRGVVTETVQSVSISVWLYAILLGILGYLFYGVLAAFVGSLVSKVEDINQFMAPISYLLMFSLVGALIGINSPSSILITIGSYIPFFAPMFMFIRISFLEIPLIEIIFSLSILIASIGILMSFCVHFYKGSVLLYSNQPLYKSMKSAWKLAGENNRT